MLHTPDGSVSAPNHSCDRCCRANALLSPTHSSPYDGESAGTVGAHRGEHVDVAAWRERVEAVLGEPADRQQASQRPPCADRVGVAVGAVAGDDLAEVAASSELTHVAEPDEVADVIAYRCEERSQLINRNILTLP
jgi:hypothetical protein